MSTDTRTDPRDRIADAILESDMIGPRERAAIGEVASAASARGADRASVDECRAASRARRAKLSVVLAAFGWLRDRHTGDVRDVSALGEEDSPSVEDGAAYWALTLYALYNRAELDRVGIPSERWAASKRARLVALGEAMEAAKARADYPRFAALAEETRETRATLEAVERANGGAA